MKTLLSLFDHSGEWARPYWQAGWNVIQWDIKLDEFMDINLVDSAETALELFDDVDGILAAVPCTDFTVSCAWCWGKKDENGSTQKSLELVNQVKRLVDLYKPTDPDYDGTFFWAIENPVGRMAKLAGFDKPYYFDPHEFSGYLDLSNADILALDVIRQKDGIGLSKQEVELVIKTNAYTKKTGLWGEFNHPVKNGIDPVRCSKQGSFTQLLGGKSARTKELRSITPAGFAQAFYLANN